MEALFKMNIDCGRMGNLESVFVAEKEDIDYMIKNKVGIYFGEVLGKHSEILGSLDNPLTQMLSVGDTDNFEESEDSPIEWSNCMVQEYIDFKRKGTIPEYYKEEYLTWVKNNSNK